MRAALWAFILGAGVAKPRVPTGLGYSGYGGCIAHFSWTVTEPTAETRLYLAGGLAATVAPTVAFVEIADGGDSWGNIPAHLRERTAGVLTCCGR